MQDLYEERQRILLLGGIVGAILLLCQCFKIQIWDTSYQKQQSFRKAVKLYPSRGVIKDRNGALLVYNLAMYDLNATYNQLKKAKIDTAEFCKLLGITDSTFKAKLSKDFRSDEFSERKPFEFLTKIPADIYAPLGERIFEFPGIESERKNVRGYPVNSAAHALGYISEVNQRQIKSSEGFYQRGEYLGISGLELSYEKQLRGERGKAQVLRDKWGKLQGKYKEGVLDISAASGNDLVTSLDLELQRYGEQLMQNKRGAIVAIEPQTGEILAMVSAPAYDPSILAVNQNRQEAFKQLRGNKNIPLFNRALMAKYPPGSIFKPILSAIALQEGIVTPNRSIPCRGAYVFGDLRVGCHGHGAINGVGNAIQYSCNNYYCQIFKELVNVYGFYYPEKGLDRLAEHLYAFGLGRKLGVDLPNETKGHVPTTAFYNKRHGKGKWKFSQFVSVGIGQGELEITPLQMANLAAIVANRGYYYTPHLAKEIIGDTSSILDKYKKRNYTKVFPHHFDAVVRGMRDVVLAGTARNAQIKDITICGKTGTVENRKGKDHSTFIAFAPKENPKIAIAVYVENGGYGSSYAAPISSLMVEKYLNDSIKSPARLALEKRMLNATLIQKEEIPATQ